MRIVQLNAENIKRLVAVEIRPEGNLVEITGRNGQGKTSVLDAIWWALDTNKVVQSKPVREGADKGFVRLDLGDYVVTKRFRNKDDGDVAITLTVENADGAKFGSPTELIAKFIGDLTFDPLAFSRMKPRDQVTALRAMVPGYDFAAADRLNKADFDKRTDINRQARDLEGQIKAIVIPEDAPTERVSLEALMKELEEALQANSDATAKGRQRDAVFHAIETKEGAIRTTKESIQLIEQRLLDEKRRLIVLEQEIEEMRDELDGIVVPDQVDTAQIRLRIADSEELNAAADRCARRDQLIKQQKGLEAQSEELTSAITDRKSSAAAAVRAAKLPVEGLELTEDAVLLNSQPFDQASDAEQLRASIAIAGAMNPKLRVIRVRDGSLLDDEAMTSLRTYAEEHDMQIWIERVDSSGKVGVVIEDGQVAGLEVAA